MQPPSVFAGAGDPNQPAPLELSHESGYGAGVDVEQAGKLARRQAWTNADESDREPLRRRQSHPGHHAFRDALQLVVYRPDQPDEFQDGINRAIQRSAWRGIG